MGRQIMWVGDKTLADDMFSWCCGRPSAVLWVMQKNGLRLWHGKVAMLNVVGMSVMRRCGALRRGFVAGTGNDRGSDGRKGGCRY